MDDIKILETLANISNNVEFVDTRDLIQQSALAYLGGGMAEIAIG